MTWLESGRFATAELKYSDVQTGMNNLILTQISILKYNFEKGVGTLKYNATLRTEIVYFTQQFSSWLMTKNMESNAEGKTINWGNIW
jgi:hypothetical protein